jgi:hypothetical protein
LVITIPAWVPLSSMYCLLELVEITLGRDYPW